MTRVEILVLSDRRLVIANVQRPLALGIDFPGVVLGVDGIPAGTASGHHRQEDDDENTHPSVRKLFRCVQADFRGSRCLAETAAHYTVNSRR